MLEPVDEGASSFSASPPLVEVDDVAGRRAGVCDVDDRMVDAFLDALTTE